MQRLLFSLVFSLFAIYSASAAVPSRLMTVDDLWKLKRIGAPSISPDGAWCVADVTTWDVDKDESTSQLWLFATDGSSRRPLTQFHGKNSSPRWSPDGKSIAFISKREGDDVNQIYLIDLFGGEARRLSHMPMAPSSLKWAADSKTMYAIGWTWPDVTTDAEHRTHEKDQKDAKSKALVITDAAFRYWDRWLTDGKRPYVYSVNVVSGVHRNLLAGTGRHLPPYDPNAGDYDVSPDGKELCFVSENVKEVGLDSNNDLFALDLTAAKSTPRNLTADNPANDGHPVYSPDGKSIAFLRQTVKHFYADRTRLMVMNRADGVAKELGAGRPLDRSVSNPHWLPEVDPRSAPAIIGEVEDSGYIRMGIFSANDPARLLPSHFSDRSVDVAAKKPTVVFLRSDFTHPPELWAGDVNGVKRRIDDFNSEITANWKLGKVEDVKFKGAGGADVQMWIVYPPDFDPAKKWPLVQVVHGGPHNAITTDFSYRWNPELWASQGWVIGIVNFHGSSGFGQDFTDAITGDLGTKSLDDVMKSTEWFALKPWIDSNRMAAAGASYGGYMMSWMNGHTDKFKTMVCHAGVYNWHSMLASDFVKGRERSLGAPPWGDLEKIDKQNPQRLASKFKTPTLVIHGEKDYRVPVTQGLEYYNTLRQKGVPTRLLYFPDENHWVLKPQNSFVWHREVFGWIEKYIGKGPTS